MSLATPITKALQQFPYATVLTTQDRGSWNGVAAQQIKFLSEFSMRKPAHAYHVVAYHPIGKSRLVQKRDGKIHEGRIYAGMSIVIPRGYESVYEGEPIPSATLLHVPDELISRAANEIDGHASGNYEIRNVFETSDITMGLLATLFIEELNRPPHPVQALISDAISNAFAGHLLRNYNAFSIRAFHSSKLGPRVLSQIVAYIEDNFEATIRLDELAGIAGVSRFHFSRIFKFTTGMSPMAYVEQARIRKAQQFIQSGRLTLAEVALMSGFADQSHFTRRFRIHTGCTPAVFANSKGVKAVT